MGNTSTATIEKVSSIDIETTHPFLLRRHNQCFLTIHFKNISSYSGQFHIATVPSGYRPINDTFFPLGYTQSISGVVEKYGYIRTDGKIMIAGAYAQVFINCWYKCL